MFANVIDTVKQTCAQPRLGANEIAHNKDCAQPILCAPKKVLATNTLRPARAKLPHSVTKEVRRQDCAQTRVCATRIRTYIILFFKHVYINIQCSSTPHARFAICFWVFWGGNHKNIMLFGSLSQLIAFSISAVASS